MRHPGFAVVAGGALATPLPGADGAPRRRLSQRFDTGTEIDVESRAIHDKGRHGLDADGLGFLQARFVVAQMDDFEVVFRRVEGIGDVLFGGDANGATRVVENGFGFHVYLLGVVRATWHKYMVETITVLA
jgi:hypothetical protein